MSKRMKESKKEDPGNYFFETQQVFVLWLRDSPCSPQTTKPCAFSDSIVKRTMFSATWKMGVDMA